MNNLLMTGRWRRELEGFMAVRSLQQIDDLLSKVQGYDEELKMMTRQHLAGLIHQFPTLHATTSHNHSRSHRHNLLVLQGVIPIYYQDLLYNIPVAIWIPESYPKVAPRLFVTPTEDMIIKRPHRLVDPTSGMVSTRYLQAWTFPRSNLLQLVSSLSLAFGQDPPLFSKPPASPVSSQPIYPNSSCSNQMEVAALRRDLISTLVARLQTDALDARNAREKETHDLVHAQTLLRQHEPQFHRALDTVRVEKEALEQQLQMILTNNDVLESWLEKNDKGHIEFAIDDVFEPCDAQSKRLLECNSADLAIEDLLYSLERAVEEGTIPVEAYLKHVRSLSREQFFHRAVTLKIREAQIHSQLSNIASRASFCDDKRGYVLAHDELSRAFLPFGTRNPN